MGRKLNFTEILSVTAINLVYILLVNITFSLLKYFYDGVNLYIITAIILGIFTFTYMSTDNLSSDYLIKMDNNRVIAFHLLFINIIAIILIIESYRYMFESSIIYVIMLGISAIIIAFTTYTHISYNNSVRELIYQKLNKEGNNKDEELF